MIRQAHTYFLGAVSGTAVIAAAIVVFVLLVSAQALKSWPFAGLGGDGAESASTAPAETGSKAGRGVATSIAAPVAGRRTASTGAKNSHHGGSTAPGVGSVESGFAPAGDTVETGSGGGSTRNEDTSTQTDSGGGSSEGGGSSGGGDDSSGGGSGGGNGGSGGGSGGGSTSSEVTSTINNTVSGVDKTLGGALEGTGVTKVTEGVVNGVAGPESVVGQTVDKTVETVTGLLKPHH